MHKHPGDFHRPGSERNRSPPPFVRSGLRHLPLKSQERLDFIEIIWEH